MQFIYAVEKVSAVDAACLARCGLDKILKEPAGVMQAPSATPGGAVTYGRFVIQEYTNMQTATSTTRTTITAHSDP